MTTVERWSDLLDDIEAYLDDNSDCEGNSAADARPNEAMRLLQRLETAREEVGK